MTREPVRFLVFSASLRAGSLNTLLASLARKVIEANGGTVDAAAMSEFDCPSYNQDEQAKAFPRGAEELRRRIEANDAFVIASPEYNGTPPGLLGRFLRRAVAFAERFLSLFLPERR